MYTLFISFFSNPNLYFIVTLVISSVLYGFGHTYIFDRPHNKIVFPRLRQKFQFVTETGTTKELLEPNLFWWIYQFFINTVTSYVGFVFLYIAFHNYQKNGIDANTFFAGLFGLLGILGYLNRILYLVSNNLPEAIIGLLKKGS